jgi:hypothetical protein
MIPEIMNLQGTGGGCGSCTGGSCGGAAGCCNHVPDGNGIVAIDFVDVYVPTKL